MTPQELRALIIEMRHSIAKDSGELKEKLEDIEQNLEILRQYLANN
jgi:hypothetical protein